MESIFFRRLEPRRSTQTLAPNLTSLIGALGDIYSKGSSPYNLGQYNAGCGSYTYQPPGTYNWGGYNCGSYAYQPLGTYNWGGYNFGNASGGWGGWGGCAAMDPIGLQSVVGTLGDPYSRGSSLYNLGIGNVLGSCPNIDSPGLQSVVGTLGNIFRGGDTYSIRGYNFVGGVSCAGYDYFTPFGSCRLIGPANSCTPIGDGRYGCIAYGIFPDIGDSVPFEPIIGTYGYR